MNRKKKIHGSGVKYLLTSFLLLAISYCLFAQQPAGESDTLHLIAHKWKLTDIELKGQKISVSEKRKVIMEYKLNGTVISNVTGAKNVLHWKYNKATKEIIIDENLKILKITSDQMVLKENKGNENQILYFSVVK